jgi:hypothetical protein
VHAQELVIEPFVGREIRDVEYPLHFVSQVSVLAVLPMFPGAHPWEHLPFHWHDLVVHRDGRTEQQSYVPDGKGDPRPEFVRTLAEAVRGPGTLMMYGPGLEHRLRDLLDQLDERKSELRTVRNQPQFDLQLLLKMGVYHPALHASFDLAAVHAVLGEGLDVGDEDAAHAICQRLLNSRTRAPTRKKLVEELAEFGGRRSTGIYRLYSALLEATQDAVVDG